jgi:glycosyltransferase involved in cell wall biosynthesis
MKSPVSIVLVTYNRAAALAKTIETLLAQTFSDFELIICDDCSPDHTEQVVQSYRKLDPRIRYRRNTSNLRMPENMNRGIRQASGGYIANLHDGDLYDPRLIEKWKSALDRHPDAAFVFNEYADVSAEGDILYVNREDLPEVFPGSTLLEGIFYRRWRFGSPVWGTVMARRDAYERAGLFDSRFGWIADVDMWMRLAENHSVAYIAEPIIRIVDHKELPRQFVIDREAALLHTIFWESRMRFYRGRPLRRIAEACRHAGFVAAHEAYLLAIRMNAARRGWLK